MLPLNSTKSPGFGSVFYLYDLQGRQTRKAGARTYPVAYTYDPIYGEIKAQATWKDYAGQDGAAVTKRNYQPATGLLTAKLDHADQGTTY